MGHFSALRQLIEQYDKVIVFPYPHKHENGKVETIVPIKKRLKMLELFLAEFFPQIQDHLMLVNLSEELKQNEKRTEGFLHTYDYLKFVQGKIDLETTNLHVCLGIDAQESIEKNSFYREDDIKAEFGVFYLTEEKQITSGQIRKFLMDKKIIKSKKDEAAITQYLGYHVSKYVIEKNLYGLVNKKAEYTPKNSIKTQIESSNILEQNKFKSLKP